MQSRFWPRDESAPRCIVVHLVVTHNGHSSIVVDRETCVLPIHLQTEEISLRLRSPFAFCQSAVSPHAGLCDMSLWIFEPYDTPCANAAVSRLEELFIMHTQLGTVQSLAFRCGKCHEVLIKMWNTSLLAPICNLCKFSTDSTISGDAEEGLPLPRTHLPQNDTGKRQECLTNRHFVLQMMLHGFCRLTPPCERDASPFFGDSIRLVGLEAVLSPKLFSIR